MFKKYAYAFFISVLFLAMSNLHAEDCSSCGTIVETKSKTISYKCGNLDRSCTITCGKYACSDDWVVISNNCPSDQTPSDPCDSSGSFVNSFSSSYNDTFDESAIVGAASGCSPCGSTGSKGSVNQINLKRYFASRRAYKVWDLGLGQSTNFDFRLTLSEEDDGSLTIYQEVPQVDFAPMYLDGRRGDVRDGVFHGSQQNSSVEMIMLDASDNVVLNYVDAVKIKFIDFKFTTYEYEVIKLSGNDYAGRLVKSRDLRGYGFNITYKSFTQAEIDLSPNLQWQC